MQDWKDVLTFLQEQVEKSDERGYPTTLRRMLVLLHESAKVCFTLVQYLQDPENLVNKICPTCNKEFSNPSRWVKTCSKKCHNAWLSNPQGYLNDDSNTGSTVLLLQQMELEEKA